MNKIFCFFFCCAINLTASQPNIIKIVVDDMGHGDIAITGHPFIDTPNLDKLAKEGAVFKNFYAPASICSPSRASMMTGRMPYRLGIYSFIYNGGGYVHLKRSEVTYPQLLRKAGYQTALIGKWHASHHDTRAKFKQPTMNEYGFDYWYSSDNNTIIQNKPGWWKNGKHIGTQKGLAANVVGRETLEWLDNVRKDDKPFLLDVNFYEPHWFLVGPDKMVKKYEKHYKTDKQRAHFPAAIENVDYEIGRILQKLKDLGLDKNTVVIFTSDNGADQFKKGRAYSRNDGRPAPYHGGKYGLWNGSVQVPGIVKWPGIVKAGSKINAPAGGIDFMPTFCAIAGAKIPANIKIDGTDITPLLRGNKKINRKTSLQWHHYNATLKYKDSPHAAIRRGDLLLTGWYTDTKGSGEGRWYPKYMDLIKSRELTSFKLYNLSKDPLQKSDISAQHPEKVMSMKTEMLQMHKELQLEAYGWHDEFKALNKNKKGKKKRKNK